MNPGTKFDYVPVLIGPQGTRDDDMIQALAAKDKAQEFVLQSLKARVDKYRPKEV